MRFHLQWESEEELVQATRGGNVYAFNELLRRYRQGVLLTVLQIVRSRTVAEDTTQEVFITAYHALSRLREPAKFAGWLHAIARHKAHKAIRQRHPVPLEAPILESLCSKHYTGRVDPIARFWEKERLQTVCQALTLLKEDYRLVLLLRYGEEWSIAQMASFLSLPETTINWRLHQARNQLRKQLTQQERSEEIGDE